MVRQLSLPIEVIPAETVRADDGLALSSRNGFLSTVERTEAVRMVRGLEQVRAAIVGGERDFARLEREAAAALDRHGWNTEYVAVRRRQDLATPSAQDRELVVLGASKLGRTRLIDNLEIDV
jgi:pantoate--beta-alanine ligase